MKEAMSQSSEHSSKDESSQNDTEYHSKLESKLEKQVIFVNPDEEYTFLNIQFPLPYYFPKTYLRLNEVVLNLDDALLKPHKCTRYIAKDPTNAFGYIITHFNIDRVSWSI